MARKSLAEQIAERRILGRKLGGLSASLPPRPKPPAERRALPRQPRIGPKQARYALENGDRY